MAQLVYHDTKSGRYLLRQPDGTFVDYKPPKGGSVTSTSRNPGDPLPINPEANSEKELKIGDMGSEEQRRKEAEERRKQIEQERKARDGEGEPLSGDEADAEVGRVLKDIRGKQAGEEGSSSSSGENGESGESGEGGESSSKGSKKGSGEQSGDPGTPGTESNTTSGSKGNNSKSGKSGKSSSDDNPGNVGHDLTYEDELSRRVKAIQDMFEDPEMNRAAQQEVIDKVNQEKKDEETRAMEKAASSPNKKFEMSLTNFVKRAAYNKRENTWKRFNKTYANSSLIKPGRHIAKSKKVPNITVYLDCSASWNDDMLNVALDVIGTLNAYVKRQEIKFEIRYFANHIHVNKEDARKEGGTGAGPEIWDEIRAGASRGTIENVMILTDGDIDGQGGNELSLVTVPGVVWMLFMDRKASTVEANLKGDKSTEIFMLSSNGMRG